jgi:hypothetical protein
MNSPAEAGVLPFPGLPSETEKTLPAQKVMLRTAGIHGKSF